MTNDPFPWPDLLPEMCALVRGELDIPTRYMLMFTCKAEICDFYHSCDEAYAVFAAAARLGYQSICAWIYDFTRDQRLGFVLYHKKLCFGLALRYEHFHVADWAHSVGLRLPWSYARSLMKHNCFAGLRWMIDNNYYIGTSIPPEASSMPMIRWLVEEQGSLPVSDIFRVLLRGLPETRERLDYYATCTISSHHRQLDAIDLTLAIMEGRWDAVDYLKSHVDKLVETYPRIKEIVGERPVVPPGHFLSLRTGEVKEWQHYLED